MTDEERQLIESLGAKLRNSPAPEINAEADDLVRRNIGSVPNALYILTQTVLLQDLALRQMKQQNAPSFLGGAAQSGNWGRDGRLRQEPAGEGYGGGYRGSSYQTGVPPQSPVPPAQVYAQQPAQQPVWIQEQPQSRTSSFLQSAARTAAGVVAGEVAFSAISSLFGGHNQNGFFGGGGSWGGGGGWGGGGVNETVINNNYFEEAPEHHQAATESFTSDAGDQFSDDTSYDDSSGSIDI